MNKFFCANSSRDALEDKIGSATHYQTYVLIEHSTPWISDALNSPGIPENLRRLAAQLKSDDRSVRFLLISRNSCLVHQQKKVLIYDREGEEFCGGYQRYEFEVDTVEQVSGIVLDFLKGKLAKTVAIEDDYQDVLVCTHGSHDVCCVKYGIPFYKQVIACLNNWELRNTCIWQASHFGGHRFAPTAITFPDGRYYGGLDVKSLRSILTRTGSLKIFREVYRGWSILPYELQVLERELLLKFGWDWFSYKISHQILQQSPNTGGFAVEIKIEGANNYEQVCRAEIVRDEEKSVRLKGSCQAEKPFLFVKYSVDNFDIFCESLTGSSRQTHEESPENSSPLPELQNPAFDKTQEPLS